ncbi:hypothetical protein [Arthrobacter mobilis]|uniref:Uncharacterized protein n=1 Tax=Arthrobacter mobilis TaxID=2724944 RepID=A0A7X6HGT9_9MICC|nr:hypothetical protein [Arthrobacter mobilis]NKX55964.1 hypothetical protein [Arthrobacter mobilis]
MPDFITIRETIEYTVKLPDNPEERAGFQPDYLDAGDVRSIVRQEVRRFHEPAYVIGADQERELHVLYADGEEVYANRSYDAVWEHFKEMTGQPDLYYRAWGDLDDPDKSWNNPGEAQPADTGEEAAR